MRIAYSRSVAAALLLASGTARAQEVSPRALDVEFQRAPPPSAPAPRPPTPPAHPPEPYTRWYGWQILGAELVTVGYLGNIRRPPGVFALGVVAPGPVIHLLHRRPWHALGSVALAGALVGYGASLDRGHENSDWFGLGVMFAAMAVPPIDALLLGWQRVEPETAPPPPAGAVRVVPVAEWTPGRATFGVAGTF
jgi:hypothetical protein